MFTVCRLKKEDQKKKLWTEPGIEPAENVQKNNEKKSFYNSL